MLPHISKCKFRFSRDRFRKVLIVLPGPPDGSLTEIYRNYKKNQGSLENSGQAMHAS